MPSENKTVHVIDDDEALRHSLKFLLESAGIEVVTHESANAFLDIVSKIEPACIITDVRMPGLSGIDLLHRMRALKLDVPVVVITGHADVPLAVEAMKVGAADFFEKPFDDDQLVASVRAALQQQQAQTKRGA